MADSAACLQTKGGVPAYRITTRTQSGATGEKTTSIDESIFHPHYLQQFFLPQKQNGSIGN
jgi:hypothetical protein